MKVVHLLRKPCSESTVAANVLRHGTGALNIDATRIGYEHTPNPATNPLFRKLAGYKNTNASDAGSSSYSLKDGSGERNPNAGGRWPANLVLQHLDGCVEEGAKKVKGHKGYPNGPKGKSTHYSSEARSVEVRPNPWIGHADPDGTETVAAWTCAPGCPVAGLDEQSGVLHCRGNTASLGHGHGSGVTGWGKGRADSPPRPELNDGGGASRFFKQVGGATKNSTDG